jgi:RsiW-degrading membrane proteinase PrsW (M82 family)
MSGPLQHGAWAGIAGWFIGTAAGVKGKKWPYVAVGILFMALLHGLYDTFSDSLIGIFIAAMSFIIFMTYLIHENKKRFGKC